MKLSAVEDILSCAALLAELLLLVAEACKGRRLQMSNGGIPDKGLLVFVFEDCSELVLQAS